MVRAALSGAPKPVSTSTMTGSVQARDGLRAGRDLALGDQPDVRQAEVGGECGARDVDAVEALALDELRHDRREGAGEAQQGTAGERRA